MEQAIFGNMAERDQSFVPPPIGELAACENFGRDIHGSSLALVAQTGRLAKLIAKLRSDRKECFPGQLGNETCWTVILQLYAAHVDQHRLHIGRLTERSGLPATTVLRSLDALSAAGFLARSEDRLDRRRVVVELSPAGVTAMNEYLLKSGTRAAFL